MTYRHTIRTMLAGIALAVVLVTACAPGNAADPPSPLVKSGQGVGWWFVFKLNAASFPGCGGTAARSCPFGGTMQAYSAFGQQYLYASSANESLQKGSDCAGDTVADPIGATFNEIYNGNLHYLIWNDQFYDDPAIKDCDKECGSPWGHSKGVLAWDDTGNGLVMQVSTPSWPASGSFKFPRKTDGNSLGCVKDDDVLVSQHFFSLRLTKDDVIKELKALSNASVVTDPTNPQIVNNGGPSDVQALVLTLGKMSTSTAVTKDTLSSGVQLISKPSGLHVPPWQMVSAQLGGIGLRTATWWTTPEIYTTTATSEMACWDASLGKPGPVEIALGGSWQGIKFGLTGGMGPDFNHAKLGVSTSGTNSYVIFGDMNQQGDASNPQKCGSSQNGRGGTFYVLSDAALAKDVTALIAGGTAPTGPTAK